MANALQLHKSYRITIAGRVQGVGFRPYVYILAHKYDLKGAVYNNELGVIIKLQGTQNNIFDFYKYLIANPPEVSEITQYDIEEGDYEVFEDFRILPPQKSGKLNLLLSPDVAICDSCRQEIKDKSNRRYHYSFTTCVNCGPRWAITNSFPFEREHTTIEAFKMCDDCKTEYKDPDDKRFHSQTNTCASCGISMRLIDAAGRELKRSKQWTFHEISGFLKAGHIIAVKNTSGYLLCCDARNSQAVQNLRLRKNRPKKPFAVLFSNVAQAKKYVSLNVKEEAELHSRERPIVIAQKSKHTGDLALEDLAPNLSQLGVMLPYSGVLELLINEVNFPIVATSGNIHGSPIISNESDALMELGQVADYFLHHNLEIAHPQDDSVVKFTAKNQHKIILRRSRGYAPNSSGSFTSDKTILATGSHLKNTIAFKPNDYIYISEYLGNLDAYEVFDRLTNTSDKFMTLFDESPDVILVDKHPAYQSTRYGKSLASKLNIPCEEIQHHKAHFASVLGEYDLFDSKEDIMGVIWDGTGFGDDAQIWGGEFFKYHDSKIDRFSHFDYFHWLAGDKMAKEPRLSLFAMADEKLQSEISQRFTKEEFSVYETLKKRGDLKTDSVGRLFDAVASLLDICQTNTYEGQAAMMMENLIQDYDLNSCKSYCQVSESSEIPTQLLLNNLYQDYKNGTEKGLVITNFLYTLANMVFEMAALQNIKKIAFSGGVFQNSILVDMLLDLAADDYDLYFNKSLSPNDENISYGQIMYYLHIKN